MRLLGESTVARKHAVRMKTEGRGGRPPMKPVKTLTLAIFLYCFASVESGKKRWESEVFYIVLNRLKSNTSSAMKIDLEKPSPFVRSSLRHRSLNSETHLRRLNHRSLSIFRTSVRYSQKQQEYDLQQKIDLEIKMREGTAKLLAACKHMNQSLEAAKSLLTSDTRLTEFRRELQLRKSSSHKSSKSKKATIYNGNASVSEIRIPLIWKETEYFKNKGDYRRFAVFCLLQIGSEIYDTVMMNVDRNVTDISFDDTFNFHQIKPNFQFKLLVYARLIEEDLSIASTHKKFTQKISSSVSRSFGRKFMSQIKDDFDTESGPKFYLMATASLNLKDASDAVKTHDLSLQEVDKNLQLPLFGDVCCRFAVQPESQQKEFISSLVLYKESNEDPDFSLYWCSLKNFKLNLWPVKEELRNEPVFVKHTVSNTAASVIVPVNKHSKIGYQANLVTITNGDTMHFLRSCSSSAHDWYKALIVSQQAFAAWEPIAEYQMDIVSITQARPNYFLRNRFQGSLYDETPIQELKKRHSKSLSNVSSFDSKHNSFVRSSRLIN